MSNNNTSEENPPYTFTKAHQKTFNEMIQKIIDLQSHIEELTSQPFVPKDYTELMIRTPDTFHGKRSHLSSFLGQCQMVFDGQPHRFPTDYSKILYISSHFRDAAFNWIQPYIGPKRKVTTFMNSYNKFIKELERSFGEPNIKATTSRQLMKLTQTGSTSIYASEFQRLSSLLTWNEDALSFIYYQGLKDEVKDLMTHYPKTNSLSELITTSIDTDNRVYKRNLEKFRTLN